MAFNQQDRNRNENLKFVEDSNGNVAIRMKMDQIELSEGQSLKVYDHRGFLVFEVNENGDVKHKGSLIKL